MEIRKVGKGDLEKAMIPFDDFYICLKTMDDDLFFPLVRSTMRSTKDDSLTEVVGRLNEKYRKYNK